MSEFGGGADVQQVPIIALVVITVLPGSVTMRHSSNTSVGLSYYNQNRVHQSLVGDTPGVVSGDSRIQRAELGDYPWISHCNELFQTPIAA
jgi:hypothetical protein